ncbi:MAG: DUF4339 domain-containing protein [Acidisphaera sp.]|nr:DUF4339 domain-containing protein [Acidisphaera sp.]
MSVTTAPQKDWFYSRGGVSHGPVSATSLSEMLGGGDLPADTFVWCEGMSGWRAADEASGLQEMTATEPPSLPRADPLAAIPARQGQAWYAPQSWAPPRRERESYLARHWRGEHSLVRSFWINQFVLGGLFGYVMGMLARAAMRRSDPALAVGCLFATALGWLACQVWLTVGTWRAANLARENGRGVRATVVQVMLVLATFGNATQLLLKLVLIFGTTQAMLHDTPMPWPGTRVSADGRHVDFYGTMGLGSAVGFRQVLATAPGIGRVRLESVGGAVGEARQIAAAIAARQLDTEVTGNCLSACTIAFLSGTHRWLHEGARLGFHSYRSLGMTPQAILLDETIERKAFQAAGVPASFTDRIFSVPPAGMWFPTRDELLAAHFITTLEPPVLPDR